MKQELIKIINATAPAAHPTQFGVLADIPPELEWLANLNQSQTRRAYKIDVEELIGFAGLHGMPSCAPAPAPTSWVTAAASRAPLAQGKLRDLHDMR